MSEEKSTNFVSQRKSDQHKTTDYVEENAEQHSNHDNDAHKVRVRKLVSNAQETTVVPTEDPQPSKLTILLAVAIPVVMIFILVVLSIAYYNCYNDQKQQESG